MWFFEQNKQRVEVQGHLRRLMDLTTPNRPPVGGTVRSEDRYNRSIPVLLMPWEDKQPASDKAAIAITKDMSEQGVALLLRQPVCQTELLIGFWLSPPEPEPCFFRAQVEQNTKLGGGYWQIGILITEHITSRSIIASLKPMARQLLCNPVSEEEMVCPM